MTRNSLRRALGIPAVAAAVTAVAVLTGVDLPHALGIAGSAAAVLVVVGPDVAGDLEWAGAAEPPPGGRSDVDEAAWSLLDREGRVRARVLERVRRLAAARGVRLPAPPAGGRSRAVTLAELERALLAAERSDTPTTT